MTKFKRFSGSGTLQHFLNVNPEVKVVAVFQENYPYVDWTGLSQNSYLYILIYNGEADNE